MIKIDGSATFQFSLGDVYDFIDIQNLKSLYIYLCAGGVRPLLSMTFKLTEPRLMPYLGSGNILTVSFGVDEPSSNIMQFELYTDNTDKYYEPGFEITIKGAFYKPKFASNSGYEQFPNMSSLDVFTKNASNYKFSGVVTNINTTNDIQDWCREGITSWEFLADVWKHSYIDSKTFTSFAFDTDYIYFYDVRKYIQQPAKWVLSTVDDIQKKGNIISVGGYTTDNNYGYFADLIGKNLSLKVFNIDTGLFQTESYNLKSFGAIGTNKINVNTKDCANYDYSIISNDTHPNYIKAFNQNMRNNLLWSTFNIYVPTAVLFNEIKLLDTVTFNVYPEDERLEGTAVITEIMYQYEFGILHTNLTINKESPSGIKGDNN